MLPFFNKIRRNLIGNGEFYKYLKYATGEILLLVIGILIALQINTWNQKRLEHLEEVKILQSIKNDLENTIQELKFLNEIREMVLSATDEIFKMADSQVIREKDLDSLIDLTTYTPTFNNKSGVINLIFSSGKINFIKNDSIKEFLIGWPGLIEDMTEEEEMGRLEEHDHYFPTISKYLLLGGNYERSAGKSFISLQIPVLEENNPGVFLENDYAGLFKDKMFFNSLRKRAALHHRTLIESMSLISKAEKMINIIDSEINS